MSATAIKEIQATCQQWILSGFPGSKILASGGNYFAAESANDNLCLYELRMDTGTSLFPARLLEQKRLKDAVIRSCLRKHDILQAVIKVILVDGGEPQFRFDPRTSTLRWGEIYPDEDLPELETIGKKVTVCADDLVVTHKMKGFGLTLVHTYGLRLADLSSRLVSSIREHANYPALVPHSHAIHDGGICLYDRKITEWAEHSATRDPYTGSVCKYRCLDCKKVAFGFIGEDRCRTCQAVVETDIVKVKKALIAKARSNSNSSSGSTDWKAAGEVMRELMEKWKGTGNAGDKEDALWEKFQAARQPFFDARTAFFTAREAGQGGALESKTRLIALAKQHAQSSDWKEASGVMRDLMEKWKAAGNAGREHEDALWRDFSAARQTFYERQAEYFGR